ncbi:hypothetical protein LA080_000231 [Diaporthe eres]|nr:hypothetical protein LA080_000231 [Diaporthe eres]
MGSVAAPPEIAIIGAGIVGLAVAHGLISRSLGNVTVYEQSSALQENGAGVAFTKNAVECMQLLSPRATEALRAVATHSGDKDDPNEWLQWLDGHGGGRESEVEEVMMRLWVGKNGFEGCHGQHFLMGLLERLPVNTVKFNTRVIKVVEGGHREKLNLQYSNGSDVRVDAVIGCDGIKSRIRRIPLEDEHPECCAPQYTTTKWGIFDTCQYPCPLYSKGSICIVGDAAHASSPHHGAGAGVGIEDSLCLVTAIEAAFGEYRDSGDISASEAVRAAFSAYDEVRRERSQWLVKSSREVSEIYEMTYPDTGRDMEKCLKEIERRSHKIWYFDYELMLKETRIGVEGRLGAAVTGF